MGMTDPIADLLTRIRNACKEKHEKVEIPASRIKANVVRVLKEEGFIKNFRLVRDDVGHPVLKLYLKYTENGESVIRGIRRISKPGCRVYSGYRTLKKPLGGAGVSILTTSQGIMTGERASSQKLGGEFLCEVW